VVRGSVVTGPLDHRVVFHGLAGDHHTTHALCLLTTRRVVGGEACRRKRFAGDNEPDQKWLFIRTRCTETRATPTRRVFISYFPDEEALKTKTEALAGGATFNRVTLRVAS